MQPHSLSLLHLCWTRLFISLIFAGGIYSAGMHIIGVSAWVGLRWFISYILIHKCTAYTLHKSHVSLSLSLSHTHTHTHTPQDTHHPSTYALFYTLEWCRPHLWEMSPVGDVDVITPSVLYVSLYLGYFCRLYMICEPLFLLLLFYQQVFINLTYIHVHVCAWCRALMTSSPYITLSWCICACQLMLWCNAKI